MQILKENELINIFECEKYLEAREQYCIRKTREGYSIFYPDNDELCLDIDTEENYQIFLIRFKYLQQELHPNILTFQEYSSTTPGHRHIIVKLPMEVEVFERLALQAVLGSDLVKEMLSIFRVWNGDEFPSLLAMKPDLEIKK